MEIRTLENAIYMAIKNDVSFVFNDSLYLFEHQSAFNPNMPLRYLFYVCAQLTVLVPNKELPLELAVDKTVDECIQSDVLRDFLIKHKMEAKNMSIFEYDYNGHMELIREEEIEEIIKE